MDKSFFAQQKKTRKIQLKKTFLFEKISRDGRELRRTKEDGVDDWIY